MAKDMAHRLTGTVDLRSYACANWMDTGTNAILIIPRIMNMVETERRTAHLSGVV